VSGAGPPSELQVALEEDECAIERLRADWERLEAADPDATPFNSWLWNMFWWRHYGAGARLCLLVVRRADEVIGIAPMYCRPEREHRVLKRRVLRFIGTGGDTSPDYLGVVAAAADRESVIAATLDTVLASAEWSTLELRYLAVGSVLNDVLQARLSALPGRVVTQDTLVLVEALPATWEAYRRSLTTKRRKQLKHRRNRLDKAGVARFVFANTTSERKAASDSLVALHRERWSSKSEAGAFSSVAYEAFHRDVIEAFAARDQLRLLSLELDGETIGVLYAFAWRGQLMLFQSGLSPRHVWLSPGHLLFEHVIHDAIDRGMSKLDLLKGDYAYKTAWARTRTWVRTHRYMRPGASVWLAQIKDHLRTAT